MTSPSKGKGSGTICLLGKGDTGPAQGQGQGLGCDVGVALLWNDLTGHVTRKAYTLVGIERITRMGLNPLMIL